MATGRPRGRPRKVVTTELEIPDESTMETVPWTRSNGAVVDPEDDIPVAEETSADRVARMLAMTDDEHSKVSIYRIDKFTKKRSWCEDMSASEFEAAGLAQLRQKWGPGEYDIRLLVPRPGVPLGRGMSGYLPKTAAIITLENVPESAKPATGATAPNSELAQVLAAIVEGQRELQRALTERPPAPDPMIQMGAMLTLMTQMREAMGLNQAPAQQKSSVAEIVDAIKELKGAAELINDKEPPETIAGLLPGVLETIKTMAGQPRPNPMGAQPVEPMPSIVIPQTIATHQPPAPASAPTGEQDMNLAQIAALAQLKKALQPLLDMAVEWSALDAEVPEDASSDDPRAIAANTVFDRALDYVCDTLPEDVAAELHNEQWLQMLTTFVPETQAHAEFLTLVRDEYIALPEDEAPAGDSSAQSPTA